MTVKKKKDNDFDIDGLDLKMPTKKEINNVRQYKAPSFYVTDVPLVDTSNRGLFKEVSNIIINLEEGKCVIVSTEGTGLTLTELQKKIASIAFNHKKKYVDKDFTTSRVNKKTLQVCRIK